MEHQDAQEKVSQTTDELTQATKDATIAEFEHALTLADGEDAYQSYKESVIDAFNKGQLSADEARTLI